MCVCVCINVFNPVNYRYQCHHSSLPRNYTYVLWDQVLHLLESNLIGANKLISEVLANVEAATALVLFVSAGSIFYFILFVWWFPDWELDPGHGIESADA